MSSHGCRPVSAAKIIMVFYTKKHQLHDLYNHLIALIQNKTPKHTPKQNKSPINNQITDKKIVIYTKTKIAFHINFLRHFGL